MKSEIRGLEQAVCSLVAKLEILLTAEWGLKLLDANHGLHISTPDHLGEYSDAFVTIRPTRWPSGTWIHAHFYHGAGGWTLCDGGQIWADHLQIPVHGLRFTISEGCMGICLQPDNDQKQFVQSGYKRLIESLRNDVVAHR